MRWSYELRYDPKTGFHALFWDAHKTGSPIADYVIVFGQVKDGVDVNTLSITCVELCMLD